MKVLRATPDQFINKNMTLFSVQKMFSLEINNKKNSLEINLK